MNGLDEIMSELQIETEEELQKALEDKQDQRILIRQLREVLATYERETEIPAKYGVENND